MLHLGKKRVKKIQQHRVYYLGFNYRDDYWLREFLLKSHCLICIYMCVCVCENFDNGQLVGVEFKFIILR